MSEHTRIAVIGEIYVDHIFTDFSHMPLPGEEVFAEHYHREAGGGTVNTACALARLGHQVSIFGALGKDEEGWLKARLHLFGVDSSNTCSAELPNALTVSMSTTADRSFLSYAGANRLLEHYLTLPETLAGLAEAAHVHFAMPLSRTLAQQVLPVLRREGCTVSLDPGWRKSWLLDPQTLEVLRNVDLFLPNESEAELMTGQRGAREMLRELASQGVSNVVVKLGSRGAAMLHGDRFLAMEPPPVRVVDTTGAGDAFDAGFLDAWLAGAPVEEQLQRACICGSLSTRARGALSALPSRAELLEMA